MRTIAYVDGFNLYFGCLSRSARHCRWLDVEALVRRLVRDQDPASEVVGVKYFSAMIDPKLSPRGPASVVAQRDYWNVLRAHSSPSFQIIKGKYFIVEGNYHRQCKPVDLTQRVPVLRPEEKQTDVNIALHMLADATDKACDQQVLFSNDSDCTPALACSRERHPEMRLGTIAPLSDVGQSRHRRHSVELEEHSHWTRSIIRVEELEACQLPIKVRTPKRVIRKPDHWQISP